MGLDCSLTECKRHPGLFLASTTDFFFPLVDDPFLQGQIAASNVLSDLYSAGISDIDSVLMALALPRKIDPCQREILATKLMQGFKAKCEEAGSKVAGGQTIFNPWCLIGGTATTLVSKDEFLQNRNSASPGDVLLLTKPLGTQPAVVSFEWMNSPKGSPEKSKYIRLKQCFKNSDADEEVKRMYSLACASMSRLNLGSAVALKKFKARAATDVTGFGLLGHLQALVKLQEQEVSFVVDTLPVFRGTVAIDEEFGMFKLRKGLSPETSGGILAVVSNDQADKFISFLEEEGWPCFKVGRVLGSTGKREAWISPSAKTLEI